MNQEKTHQERRNYYKAWEKSGRSIFQPDSETNTIYNENIRSEEVVTLMREVLNGELEKLVPSSPEP